jgi:GNAT superfamily N-acetyltransferase
MPDELLDGLSVERRAAVWRSIVETDRVGEAVLVLEGDAGIEGFAHLCAARFDGAPADTGEVTSIYLLPGSWGRGWGRTLMEASIRRMADEGYRRAILWVLEGNERARRFYEAAGWTLDGAQKTEHIGVGTGAGAGTTITEVRYRRNL